MKMQGHARGQNEKGNSRSGQVQGMMVKQDKAQKHNDVRQETYSRLEIVFQQSTSSGS